MLTQAVLASVFCLPIAIAYLVRFGFGILKGRRKQRSDDVTTIAFFHPYW
jgi:hypothetical protein